jgi:hypothetical protein
VSTAKGEQTFIDIEVNVKGDQTPPFSIIVAPPSGTEYMYKKRKVGFPQIWVK